MALTTFFFLGNISSTLHGLYPAMRSSIHLTLFLLLIPPAMHARENSCPAHPATVAAMRDCYRPLLIFAPSASDARLQQQLKAFDPHTPDFRERDVLVVVNTKDGKPVNPSALQSLRTTKLDAAESEKLRHRFNISDDSFVVLLVGKDGGEKYRSENIVTVATLNHKIDAMPMRRAEQNQ